MDRYIVVRRLSGKVLEASFGNPREVDLDPDKLVKIETLSPGDAADAARDPSIQGLAAIMPTIERNSPAFGPDIGFADVEEIRQPLFRGNGSFHFRKRTIGERIHELTAA